MKKLFGFTLAEVLITMSIIGVVSVMVLPNLKLTYSRKVVLAQLEKTYSTLTNTIRMAEYNNGKMKRWDMTLSGEEFFNKYLKNSMKYAVGKKTYDDTVQLLDGSAMNAPALYTSEDAYHVTMMDGSIISFLKEEDLGMWVGIDANGDASPNTLGKDIYLFFLTKNEGLQPLGYSGSPASYKPSSGDLTRTNMISAGNNACHKDRKGYWCAALVMYDGWKYSKDYPWKK